MFAEKREYTFLLSAIFDQKKNDGKCRKCGNKNLIATEQKERRTRDVPVRSRHCFSLPPLLFLCLDREGVGHTDSMGEPSSTDIYSTAALHLLLTQLKAWSNSWQDLSKQFKASGYIKTKIYSMGESCCCCRKLQSISKHTHATKSTVKYPGDATDFTWQPLGGEY